MTTWITDDNGNRASVEYFGSREAAQAVLDSLVNCRNCINCMYCTGCTGCTDCMHCTDCINCTGCTRCMYCTGCTRCMDCAGCKRCTGCTGCMYCINCRNIKRATNPRVVGPFRSDGYQFVMNADGGIRAGCRVFDTMAEARTHWQDTRGGTPLGDETMVILDMLEALDACRSGNKE